MNNNRIVILGAGPAGVGAAWRLRIQNRAQVTVLEQRGDVGGNAGSFDLDGLSVDYGSHRLHPACDPDILRDLKAIMGDQLLDRPRHGRIRLRGRWIHFPLKPVDLALRLPPSFGLGVVRDIVAKRFGGSAASDADTFATVMQRGLGRTICRDFYFPYAVKIWGEKPDALSGIQARRRVAAGSVGKLIRKVLSIVPGLKKPGAGRFYYPRRGFGQISRCIAEQAQGAGAELLLNSTVQRVTLGRPHRVEYLRNSETAAIDADHVWSTIPISLLARMVQPAAPEAVTRAAASIRYRAMVLIYLTLATDQFNEFDAHYFPEADMPLTRLSEPKNYCASREPAGRTVLCGELPCNVGDDYWKADDDALGRLMKDGLERSGLPVRAGVLGVATRRLSHAYPIYDIGYERHFQLQDEWMDSLDRVLTFGRQGLFAHDNTHHALAMSYGAVNCLTPSGDFDRVKWHEYRRHFATHVVED